MQIVRPIYSSVGIALDLLSGRDIWRGYSEASQTVKRNEQLLTELADVRSDMQRSFTQNTSVQTVVTEDLQRETENNSAFYTHFLYSLHAVFRYGGHITATTTTLLALDKIPGASSAAIVPWIFASLGIYTLSVITAAAAESAKKNLSRIGDRTLPRQALLERILTMEDR